MTFIEDYQEYQIEDYREYQNEINDIEKDGHVSVSNNIIDKMQERQMTFSDINRKTGMSYKKIRYYLQEEDLSEYQRLRTVCRALGISMRQLLTESEFHKTVAEKSYGNQIISGKKECLRILKRVNNEEALDDIITKIQEGGAYGRGLQSS